MIIYKEPRIGIFRIDNNKYDIENGGWQHDLKQYRIIGEADDIYIYEFRESTEIRMKYNPNVPEYEATFCFPVGIHKTRLDHWVAIYTGDDHRRFYGQAVKFEYVCTDEDDPDFKYYRIIFPGEQVWYYLGQWDLDFGESIWIPYDQLVEFEDLNSCAHIVERKNIKGIAVYNGVQYCINGSCGSYNNGCSYVNGNRIVPLAEYYGLKVPVGYGKHDEPEYERGYKYMIINHKSGQYVCMERVQFMAIPPKNKKDLHKKRYGKH